METDALSNWTNVYSTKPQQLEAYFSDMASQTIINNAKKLKKTLRSNPTHLLFLHVCDAPSLTDAKELIDYLRNALEANVTWTTLLCSEDFKVQCDQLMLEHQFDDVIVLQPQAQSLIKTTIDRRLERIARIQLKMEEKDGQTNMLTSVNRFSHQRQNIQELIESCATALMQFSHSQSALMVKPSSVTAVSSASNAITQHQLDKLDEGTLENIKGLSLSCQAPLVELNPKLHKIEPLINALPHSVGSYLVFPVTAYKHTLASVLCFISEEQLDRVTTTQINVMRDACIQLTLTLERRFAESRMVSHYQRLKDTLSELKTTQNQLVHAEKMASVGQMAAGIAHEINNPLSFVISNFEPLDDYVDTLVNMVDLHEQLMASLDDLENAQEQNLSHSIKHFKEENDVGFVTEDIKVLVQDSKEGLLRVRDIINDLGSFSRKDSLEKSEFNLSDVIGETLRLLKFELLDGVVIEHKIDENIVISAHKGFMQQILSNLVKNASQAHNTNDSRTNKKAYISINSVQDDQSVSLIVSDNAGGIPQASQKHIFDPFFTTKEIGKGTGLGLSVSFNLAKKMKGNLSLIESNDEKTSFQLTLPR